MNFITETFNWDKCIFLLTSDRVKNAFYVYVYSMLSFSRRRPVTIDNNIYVNKLLLMREPNCYEEMYLPACTSLLIHGTSSWLIIVVVVV